MAGNSSRLRWSKELPPRPNCNAIQFCSFLFEQTICSLILYENFEMYATKIFIFFEYPSKATASFKLPRYTRQLIESAKL